MLTSFRIILIIVSILTFWYMMRKIRKSQVQIEDSLFWIAVSICFITISIFPELAEFMANLLGIGSTVNFVFLAIIFILLMKVFFMSIKISQLESKLHTLIQKFAIEEKDIRDTLKN